jgi:hypothetical protein
MKLFPNSITMNTANPLRKKKGGFMLLPAILATALTACPQPPAPQPEQPVETRALTAPRDIMLHGIVAGTTFNANQSLTLNNASVFANAGLVLNSRSLSLNGNLISSTSAATCTDNSGQNLCVNGKPKFVSALVNVPKPDFAALKTKYNATPITTIQNSLNLNSSSEISAKFDNQIILVKGSVSLNAIATIKNAVLIVSETFKSNKGLTLENSRIIAKEAQFNQTSSLTNSRILTDEDLTFNGKLESNGLSSAITNKNFTSNGTGMVGSSGELAVIANQNITLNQVSSGKMMLWAGGNVTVNQSLNLEGAMVAGAKVVLNSSVSVKKVSSHLNPDVLGGGSGREVATIQPGGSVTFSNGIRVDVPSDRTHPIELYIEEVPSSTVRVPLEGYAVHAISPYYRIGTTGDDTGSSEAYRVISPVPVGEDYRNLGVMFLTPNKGGIYDDFWAGSGGGTYTDNNLPFTYSSTIYHDGSIYVLVKQDDINLSNSMVSNRFSTRVESPYKINCFREDECPEDLKNKTLTHVNDAYNHWIGVMQLNEKEHPSLKNIQIQSNKRKDCLKLGSDGIYIYIDKTIYICIQKNSKDEWIFSANENKDTIKEVVFHEMFHAVQAGIATGAKSNSEDAIPVNPYSTWWIMEGTAAAAANSGTSWEISKRHAGKSVNTEFYKIAGKLSETEKYYEVHDYWIHSLSNIYATKNLFKINKNKTYSTTDLNYNVQLVTELLGETNPNYIRDTYWKWVKDQALELNNDVLNEKNPCQIYRLATQTEIGYDPRSLSGNSIEIDFKAVFIDKDPTAIAKIPKTLPATPLTSRLWNFTFNNISGQYLLHFNLSSTQPNAKFHIYKLPKNLPAGYTGCQDPQGLQDYSEAFPPNKPGPRDILVDNNTRIVVLGSNLEYVNPADLSLEMSVLGSKKEQDSAYTRGEPWLSTFDQEFLGFHAVGEFILSKSTTDNFEVQVRYVPGRENTLGQTLQEVSFNGAVAVKVGSDRVGVYASKGRNTCWTDNTCDPNYPTRPQVRVNGQVIMPPIGSAYQYQQVLPDGGEVSWSGDEVTISSASRTDTVRVHLFADAVGSVEVNVSPERAGNLVGLFGDDNNDKSDDYRLRNGALLASPLTRDQLYLEWGESWRVDQYESLFDYEDNQGAYSFVDRSFPTRVVSLEGLSVTARAAGESACQAAGVVDANAFNSCVIDVALTGNPGWADIAKGLDPGSKHIRVSPLRTTVVAGEKVQLSVDVSGVSATQNVIWNANGGSIVGSGALVEFVAPLQAGAYLVSVRSAQDSSLQASIPIEVVEEVQPMVDRFAVGSDNAALLNSSGFVSVWGRDLLNNQNLCSDRGSTFIDGVSQVRSVSTSNYGGFMLANTSNGNLMTWGQLAHAVPEFSNAVKLPMVLSTANHWVGVTASNNSLVSLKRDGTAWYWLPVLVAPYAAQLKPFLVTGVSSVVGLSPRAFLKRDGTVWQLEGEYNFTDYVARASQVAGLNQVIQVSSSDSNYHYLALKSDGTVWAWGANDSSQLGLGLTSGVVNAPQQVPNLTSVVKVFVGQGKSYALKSDGTLWVWGANDGRIDAAPSVLTSPTQVPNLSQVKDFRASNSGIYVVKQDNTIFGWGDNNSQTIKCSSEPADRSILFPTLIPGVTW